MTIKPDWKHAPEWARWLCQDRNGRWIWFEYKPKARPASFEWINGRRIGSWEYAEMVIPNWNQTLEPRP